MNDLINYLFPILTRIAEALERLAPLATQPATLGAHDAFIWEGATSQLFPVRLRPGVSLSQLRGIDRQIETLRRNTEQFVDRRPANNALLWGAKGMGKSTLVKALHATLIELKPRSLALVEIPRDELGTLPALLKILSQSSRRFLLYCDDLSFDVADDHYKSLKAVLEGGIAGRPENVIFYATSNRRHLMAREMIDNEQSTAINPAEAIDEKVSLSDRFGLWLGFHNCDQATYFDIVDTYARDLGLQVGADDLHAQANEWAMTRGARSGRVAWQFIQDLAGRLS